MESRVYNIKKKFEGLCEAAKDQNKSDNLRCDSGVINLGSQQKNKLEIGTTCTSTAGSKNIIKRSHAFRSDRCNRNSLDDSKVTLKTEPIKNLSKSKEKTNSDNYNKSQAIFLSKILESQDSSGIPKMYNKANFTGGLDENNCDSSSVKKMFKNDPNSFTHNPGEYSVVSKIKRPNGSQSNCTGKIESDSLHGISNTAKNDKTPPINSCKQDILHNTLNSCPENSCKRNINKLNPTLLTNVDKDHEDTSLSNTLKKVLNTPLPTGPPPKKPPRTFAHGAETASGLTNSLMRFGNLSSDDINIVANEREENQIDIKPIRSKTESQIMLKKLEMALINHKNHGKILEPKIDGSQTNASCNSKANYEKSLPVTPVNKQSLSNGCFGIFSCSNVTELNNISHIYDIPEYKSKFHNQGYNGNSVILPASSNLNFKENCSLEHIYAKPQIKNKCKSVTSKLKSSSSVASKIQDINSTGYDNSSVNKERTQITPTLHYMSSPVLESASFNKPTTSLSNNCTFHENKNFETKNSSSKSSSLEWDSNNSKVSNRSLNLNITKDFQIDNEKIQMMVNEVYSKCLAMPQDSDSESIASTPEEGASKLFSEDYKVSQEEAFKERQQRTAERKSYLKRVCSRAKSIVRNSVDYPHLFEYLLLIGLDLNPARCKVPYIKEKYPADAEIPRGIEQLCFPDASDWPPQANAAESGAGSCYCLVITNENGVRKYGYCRRVQPEGAPICLPLAYCIVSPYKANYYFSQVLAELESRHGQPEQIMSSFIHQLYENPFPAPGQGLRINNPLNNESRMEILTRKLDPRQEETDIARLLNLVRFSVFLQLFATLLLERKVILLSYSISNLSTCIEGLCAALYPFHWQHTLVPIVPSTMLDLCHAPTPYLIGLLKPRDKSQQPPDFNSIDQVLIVDVDESRVIRSSGDESTVIPSRLCRGLREALQCAVVDKQSIPSPSHNLVAAEALMALFVQLVGHYHNHIYSPSSTDERKFQRDSFIKSVSSNTLQNFLDWFSESTMFTAFIESRLDRTFEAWGLFEQRCVEHFSQQQAPISKSYRANINKTVKSFGDRLKEWTSS